MICYLLIYHDLFPSQTNKLHMAANDLQTQLSSLVLEDVEVTGKELGRGAYGVVYEVRVNGLVCAGKKLHDSLEVCA